MIPFVMAVTVVFVFLAIVALFISWVASIGVALALPVEFSRGERLACAIWALGVPIAVLTFIFSILSG